MPSTLQWRTWLLSVAQHALDVDRVSPEETGRRLSLLAPLDAPGETAWRAATREMLVWDQTDLSLGALWALIRRREIPPAAADQLLQERSADPRWAHALSVALLVMRDTGTTHEEAARRVQGYRWLVTRVSMLESSQGAPPASGGRLQTGVATVQGVAPRAGTPGAPMRGVTMQADTAPTAKVLWIHLAHIDVDTALATLGDILSAHLTGQAIQIGSEAGEQTDRQGGEQTDVQTGRPSSETGKHIGRQASKWADDKASSSYESQSGQEPQAGQVVRTGQDMQTRPGFRADHNADHNVGIGQSTQSQEPRVAKERLWGKDGVWGPVTGQWLGVLEDLSTRDPALAPRLITARLRSDPEGAAALARAWNTWRQSPDVIDRKTPELLEAWDLAMRSTPDLRSMTGRTHAARKSSR